MPAVAIDLTELSGVTPGTDNLQNAPVWFYPYRPYGSPLVTTDKLVVPTVLGVASTFLPETPTGNAMWVEIRGVRLPSDARKFLVAIPGTDCRLFDLSHLDESTLDPTLPTSPAWVADLEQVNADLDDKADTSALAPIAAAADAAQTAATTARATADSAVTGLGNKVNTSTYTTGIAAKTDKASNLTDLASLSTARENLAVADYVKLLPFFADLANWRNKRVDIAFFGDSAPEGYGLTDWNYTLPAQLCAILRSKNGIPVGGRGLVAIQNDKTHMPFWPQAYTGGNITALGYGPNMRQDGLGSGNKIVQTVPAAGLTAYQVHYALYGAGTLYHKADTGSATNIVTNGTAAIVPAKSALITGVVASTVEVGWVSGAPFAAGIHEFKGDENSGLQVHNLGMSGTYAKYWNDRAALSWPACAALLAPSLMVVNLGGNDGRSAGGNRTAAQFGADLTTLLNTLGTLVSTTAPIVVLMQWSLGDAALLEPWANYVAAAKAVAAANPRAVVVDCSGTLTTGRMYPSNTVPDTLALYNAASPPHGTAKGYALEATTIAKALEPR